MIQLARTLASSSFLPRRLFGPACTTTVGAIRHLNVHEYISMEIMRYHDIETPECGVASTPQEAENIFLHKLNKRTCSQHGTQNFFWVGVGTIP